MKITSEFVISEDSGFISLSQIEGCAISAECAMVYMQSGNSIRIRKEEGLELLKFVKALADLEGGNA